MQESSCFQKPFWSQRVNKSKTMSKCERQWFYGTFPWIWDKSTTQTSPLVRSKILGLYFNRSTGDDMYSHLNKEIFPQLVLTQLS